MKHPGLKIAALFCALALWFYVAAGQNYRINKEIPLILSGLNPDMAISNQVPKKVPVLLEGQGWDLIQMHSELGHILVDLSDANLGIQKFSINSTDFIPAQNRNLKVLQILGQQNLELHFDSRIYKKVPVRNRAHIEADSNFILVGPPEIIPPEIEVGGSRRSVTRVLELFTEEIKISGLRKDTTLSLYLDLGNSTVEPKQSAIQLKVSVQALAKTTISNIPIQLIGRYDREKYHLAPSTVQLQLTGGQKNLSSIKPEDISVFVEFSRFAVEGKDSIAPTLILNTPVQSYRVTPEKVALDSL